MAMVARAREWMVSSLLHRAKRFVSLSEKEVLVVMMQVAVAVAAWAQTLVAVGEGAAQFSDSRRELGPTLLLPGAAVAVVVGECREAQPRGTAPREMRPWEANGAVTVVRKLRAVQQTNAQERLAAKVTAVLPRPAQTTCIPTQMVAVVAVVAGGVAALGTTRGVARGAPTLAL
jgi:hypothetical protein